MRGDVCSLPQYVFMALCLVKHTDNFSCNFNRFNGRAYNEGVVEQAAEKGT
jgi:hypothetical protein